MPDRDGFIIMLSQSEEKTNNIDSWDAYFWVKDANALYAEFKEKGALISYKPELKETYGCLEFAVNDIDDHLLHLDRMLKIKY